jgi:glycosyltransferase involved in cell wall biosynthesis
VFTASLPPELPLRIIYLSNSFNVGGAEQLNLEIVRQLSREDFTFEFVFLKDRGSLAGELEQLGIPVRSGFLRGTYDLGGLPRMWQALRGTRADVLFMGSGLNSLFIGNLLSRRLGAKGRISALHTTRTWGRDTAIRPLQRRLLNGLDGIIAVAPIQKEYLVRDEGLARDKIQVIFNGVDHHRFKPLDDPGLPLAEAGLGPEDQGIAVVASLTPEKGHDVLVQAAARVLPRFPRARFLIMGQGPQRESIERQIGQLGVGEGVRLLGLRRDLPRILPACQVHVLPSHPYRETLPISTMEGMACGLATINTDVGSVRDLVVDGETGLIVPPGDPEALAAAMMQLLGDDGLRKRMGRQARRRIEEGFTLERTVRDYAAYFRRWDAGPFPSTSPGS